MSESALTLSDTNTHPLLTLIEHSGSYTDVNAETDGNREPPPQSKPPIQTIWLSRTLARRSLAISMLLKDPRFFTERREENSATHEDAH